MTAVLRATNAASPLTIPTYEGSGQVVHPDVIDFGPSGWNGHRYWMAVTPFPGANADYENPSILVSSDGITWSVPAGLTNPIDPKPSGGHNADTDLMLGQDGVLYCYYNDELSGSTVRIRVRTSTDGVTWSGEITAVGPFTNAGASPSVLWDGTQYAMWYVNYGVSPNVLNVRYSASPTDFSAAPTLCVLVNVPSGKEIWHQDMLKIGAEYHAFITVQDLNVLTNTQLYFATSPDGVTWTFQDDPLIDKAASGAWDDANIYRSTAVPIVGGYTVWYSAENTAHVWHVARVTAIFDANSRSLRSGGVLLRAAGGLIGRQVGG